MAGLRLPRAAPTRCAGHTNVCSAFGRPAARCWECQTRQLRRARPVKVHATGPQSDNGAEPNTQEQNGSLSNKLGIERTNLNAIARGWSDAPMRVADDILASVADLPMTNDVGEYCARSAAVQHWKTSLQKGILPDLSHLDFPIDPFKKQFATALSNLEMPRFTRRYPKLADAVLRQMLSLTKDFETEYLAMLEEQAKKQPPPQQQQQQNRQQGQQQEQEDGEEGESGEAAGGEADPNAEAGDGGQQDIQDQLEAGEQGQEGSDPNFDLQIEDAEGEMGDQAGEAGADAQQRMEQAAEDIAKDLTEQFEEEMAPIMENLEAAMQHFGDLDDLLQGPKGWDLSKGVWQESGWREFQDLRKKLENLRELRDLVRKLGRGGGLGPKRRAPEQLYASGAPPGVIRSSLVPEEVRGLHKSGDLSQMLPAEAALLAWGWPARDSSSGSGSEDDSKPGRSYVSADARSRGAEPQAGPAASAETESDAQAGGEAGGVAVAEPEADAKQRGSHPARLLFMARLAEKGLLSYQRAGWIDNEPSRVTTRQEIRPAVELGPIIVCLDTSGSMSGAREVVAKAVVLECMRGAHTQGRRCFVYAFSGPGEVKSLELDLSPTSLQRLLRFLKSSFSGGTDVDRPFELSLARLQEDQWNAADILMVTDGEIRPPSEHVLTQVKQCHEDMGLEVHGLLVGTQVTEAMKALCTHIHLFKSWSAVGGRRGW